MALTGSSEDSSDDTPANRCSLSCGSKFIHTWTPKVGKIMAFMAIIRGLGPLFYILLGFRYLLRPDQSMNRTVFAMSIRRIQGFRASGFNWAVLKGWSSLNPSSMQGLQGFVLRASWGGSGARSKQNVSYSLNFLKGVL